MGCEGFYMKPKIEDAQPVVRAVRPGMYRPKTAGLIFHIHPSTPPPLFISMGGYHLATRLLALYYNMNNSFTQDILNE